MKNAVFWEVAPCRFVYNDVSEERVASIFRVEKNNVIEKVLDGCYQTELQNEEH
jgi:hypothetical protein